MNSKLRTVIYLILSLLAIGSCFIWGFQREWVAGLSLIVFSITSYVWSLSDVTDKRDKQRYAVSAFVFFLIGLLLLYVGVAPLFKK